MVGASLTYSTGNQLLAENGPCANDGDQWTGRNFSLRQQRTLLSTTGGAQAYSYDDENRFLSSYAN